MISDQELLKTFKVYFDDKEIINLVFLKIANEERNPEVQARRAELIEKSLLRLTEDNPKERYKMLVDLVPVGKVTFASDKAKRIFSHLSEIPLEKVAVVGSNLLMKIVVNVIFLMAGRSDIAKWFYNKEEAMAWLEE
ncbi:MAG: hypothetical protein A2864_01615 [Candidatus Woykebacteria bacterium RIFCSPHIGHO2_01_FULL_39_12]|uniref:DUF7793 domain-containing protein n=1 Tax=Candidatus Woykebacteria bacterium RIFCSPHIGHO2_01_FULL_39_12 TaxID=1802599 RepID=A0A1G1WJ09_9BACT|nr:MAG: hypothetical protein A2864_01615 [Candidatus Woykebacteria bacterium RIFCSPHIGHO2_01_FULL_39_12]